jgi:dCTP deaminase
MIKNAQWIIEQAKKGMITPFVENQVKTVIRFEDSTEEEPRLYKAKKPLKVVSYGCGGHGYDLKLSPKEFKVFKHLPGEILNPKNFNPQFLYNAELLESEYGQFFILPHHTYGLGVSLERIEIPKNIEVLFIGKSTYARCGIIVNMTPGEAGWRGHLTIEISNASDADAMIFANEGICQALFFEGEETSITYEGRKYQDQSEEVTLAKV